MALAWMHLSLSAMSGDDEAAARHLAEVVEYRPRLNPVMETIQVAASQLVANLWNGRIGDMVEPLVAAGAIGADDMSRGIATLGLARGDRLDLLRTLLADPARTTPSRAGPRPTPGADRPRRRPSPGTAARRGDRRTPRTPHRAGCR